MCNRHNGRSHSTSTRLVSFITAPSFCFPLVFVTIIGLTSLRVGRERAFFQISVNFVLQVFFRVANPASSQKFRHGANKQLNLFCKLAPLEAKLTPEHGSRRNVREHPEKIKHNDLKQIAFPSSVNNDIVVYI